MPATSLIPANARKLGDRLIVAVNSDASTKRLKGETRPVNALENRMIVLGALEAVDWVVPFEEDTPQRLIADILPDLLVKGGDYKPEEIAGSAEVWANGGDVKVLNFEDGLSTTNIIKAIKTGEANAGRPRTRARCARPGGNYSSSCLAAGVALSLLSSSAMRCSNSASFAGAQQHLSLYVELFAVNQIRAGQLRLQDLTDFFSTSSPRTPLGMDS